ncbi:MAG TPA: hypothetical protein VF081_02765 [Solirubrobacterales bacterium]
MNGRRAIGRLCMLCALLVSAFAAQSASATIVISGTTAFTCVNGGGAKNLRGEHCLTTGSAAQTFGHVAIAENTKTELTGTNAKTANETKEAAIGTLKVTIAGVPLELSATGVSASGSIQNTKTLFGLEHYIDGKGTITFTGVTVKAPAGRGCKVFTDVEATKTKGEQGVVHTRELTVSTEGRGDHLNLEPVDGGLKSLVNFFVECEAGKQIPAIEGTWECLGNVEGVPNGATTGFTHTATTEQNTLKCKGTKSGLEGQLTLSARETGSTGAFTPLSATTIF